MRRFVVFLLLLGLPLQYTWAAAASYCAHDEVCSGHFGHHVHKHLDDAGDGESPVPSAHADAHHGATTGIPERAWLLAVESAEAIRVVFEPHFSLSDISSEPERPKWPAAG